MKKILSMAIATTLTFAGNAVAADVEAGVVKVEQKPAQHEFIKMHPLAVDPKYVESNETKASASGIDYFEVYAVGSSQYGGWQIVPASQYSVSGHIGGTLLVAVLQRGYGNDNPATMSGLSQNSYYEERLCGTDLHVCSVGETITGWLYYYDMTGASNGQFKASANSVAYPFGYWSDTIYIN